MTTISKLPLGTTNQVEAPPAQPGPVDPQLRRDASDLVEALTELNRVIQFRDRDRACCYDVSVSQCYALKVLADADAHTVNELAARLYLDKSTASRLANSLVDLAYVRKTPDPEDGRALRLEVTPAGREVTERILSDLTVEHMQILADFDPEVRQAMTRLVARLARAAASRVDATGGTCCVVQ